MSWRKIVYLFVVASGCTWGLVAGPASAQPSAPSKPGSTFKECRNCPEMVVLPAGSFMMGSPPEDKDREEDEKYQQVTFARPFAVSKTVVTWDEWEACVRDGGCDGVAVEKALRLCPDFRACAPGSEGQPNKDFIDWGRGTRPFVGGSWYDAQAYVGWLNRKTGQDDAYRLLSDAEWEYAARAGTTTIYPWGDKIDHSYGNFGSDPPTRVGKVEGRDVWDFQTSPVASFPPNAFGLYDMHGNTFVWIEDCYEADRANAPKDGSANKNGSCRTRMMRGGSYRSNPYMQRTANRTAAYVPTLQGRDYLSIRVAKTLDAR
jgi:formylglycine-generating enzyme required for sulfatase activity